MDNVKFHHSREIQMLLRENNIVFKYLPPYSPQLNPIEEFFAMLKARYAALRKDFTTIPNCIDNILSFDFSEECRNFYHHMEDWVEKARARMDFI